jgi:type III secretion system YscD/HrpQ family protein
MVAAFKKEVEYFMPNHLIFRVLSGIYQGAELDLTRPSYTLGSGIDCDITIEDPNLEAYELSFEIKENSFIVTREGAPAKLFRINGKRLTDRQYQVGFYDHLQIGEFIFAIGSKDSIWPDPDWIQSDESVEDFLDSANDDEFDFDALLEDEADLTKDSDGKSDEHMANESSQFDEVGHDKFAHSSKFDQTESVKESEAEFRERPVYNVRGWGRIGWYSLPFVCLLGVAAFYWLNGMQNDPVQKQLTMENDPLQSLAFELESDSIKEQFQPDELAMAIEPVAVKREPETVVAQSPEMIAAKLANETGETQLGVAKSILEVARLGGISVTFNSETRDLIAKGYASDPALWQRTKQNLTRDISGISQLIDEVQLPATRRNILQAWIEKAGLKEETRMMMTPKGIFVEADLIEEDELKWKDIELQYQKNFQNQPKLFRVKPQKPWLDIKSVNFGYEPYLVTSNGHKYMIGSKIQGGYEIVSIRPSGLVLRNSEGEKNYPLP